MYHLIEIKDSIKIVKSVQKAGLKMPMLMNYLSFGNIAYAEKETDIKDDGLYCLPDGVNKYKIVKSITTDDGYFFSGYSHLEFEYSLEFVYYKMGLDYLEAVCKSLKK